MNILRNFKNIKAMSLLEVMVVMAIGFLIAVVSARIITQNFKFAFNIKVKSELLDLRNAVMKYVDCNKTLSTTHAPACHSDTSEHYIAGFDKNDKEILSLITPSANINADITACKNLVHKLSSKYCISLSCKKRADSDIKELYAQVLNVQGGFPQTWRNFI